MAETQTEKLKLGKRDTGDLNWGAGMNANFDLLDAHAAQGSLRPPRTLLASLGSGAVGAYLSGNTTYFYKIVAKNAAGRSTENKYPSVVEAQVTEPATPVPVVLQWEAVPGADGYTIYKGTSTGTEKFLADVSGGSTAQYTDDGNVETGAEDVPATNTALTSVSKIVAGTGIQVTPAHGRGEVTVESTGEAGVATLRKDGEAAGLTGDVKLKEGLNVTLTQDAPNKTIEIAAAGGAGGYATEVVVAPTGTASTDTANIANALSSASGKGGGLVVLREGTYKIESQIDVPANVVLTGMGKDTTVLEGQSALDGLGHATVNLNGAYSGLRDLTIDNNLRSGGAGKRDAKITGSNAWIARVHFKNIKGEGLYVDAGSGRSIMNCRFTAAGSPNNLIRFATTNSDRVEGCHFDGANTVAMAITIGTCERLSFVGNTSININAIVQNLKKSVMSGNIWKLKASPSTYAATVIGDCTISDNYFDAPGNWAGYTAIMVTSPYNSIVGNRIHGILTGSGIKLSSTNNTVSGNTIQSSEGININGNDNNVVGNEAGTITIESGKSGNVVVANRGVVTDNSGAANIIANNSG